MESLQENLEPGMDYKKFFQNYLVLVALASIALVGYWIGYLTRPEPEYVQVRHPFPLSSGRGNAFEFDGPCMPGEHSLT